MSGGYVRAHKLPEANEKSILNKGHLGQESKRI